MLKRFFRCNELFWGVLGIWRLTNSLNIRSVFLKKGGYLLCCASKGLSICFSAVFAYVEYFSKRLLFYTVLPIVKSQQFKLEYPNTVAFRLMELYVFS